MSSSLEPDSFNNQEPIFNLQREIQREDVKRISDELLALRERAYAHLLHPGWSFSASLSRRSSATETDSDVRRKLPSFALDGGQYNFTLLKALQPWMPVTDPYSTMEAQWGQVWTATVQSSSISSVNAPNLGTVVLKIIQPSLLPLPDPRTYKNSTYVSADRLERKEAYFYKCLESAQGQCVPYLFGRAKTDMPNGEEALVLIMEHIPGISVANWCRSFDLMERKKCREVMDRDLKVILRSAYDSASALNELGVLHHDIKPQNLVLYAPCAATGWKNQVVMVDFGFSRIERDPVLRAERAEPWKTVRWIMSFCAPYYGAYKLEAWGKIPGNLPTGVEWIIPENWTFIKL